MRLYYTPQLCSYFDSIFDYIMKLPNWIQRLLGIGNHQVNKDSEDANDVNGHNNSNSVEETPHCVNSNLRRKGISVSVEVPDDRVHQLGPVIVACPAGDGGVQGLNWHTRRLKTDEDGDVADEFLEEIFPETTSNTLSAKPTKPMNPRLSQQGTVQRLMDFQGGPQLV